MKRWTFTDSPTTVQLAEIAKTLRAEGVVVLPTDTIYGLHALATSDRAADRVAEIKGRDDTKPFVVLGGSISQLEEIGVTIPHDLRKDLESIWPAPLTAILPLRQPIAASRGAATLACRVPALTWLRELAQSTGPLLSTSANRSGEPPIDRPEKVESALQHVIDGVAGGAISSGEPSTIVDFTGDEPRLIRKGEPVFSQKVWKTLRKSL